ncbi:MAG TPA: tRNA pseudouridine(55) synthase TruB [Candidatus Scybalocola faecipullorum]|nr:tRNA pseudouridine(55) synthase TruB [Candidatus Scybalocola faecipullorum]
MIDGMLNVYKEKDFTSHDVVAKLRGILKQKKIGHTGTLDPAATGVLPVCLGRGTKLCDMIAGQDKVYEAVLLLGVTTDTQDTTGKVTARHPAVWSPEFKTALDAAAASFKGDYNQVPPMYSAIKVGGKKLYELAREGREISRKARRVHIYEIEMTGDVQYDDSAQTVRVPVRVHCSKGTYIRTLCHDIGEKMGCGGCMEALTRIRVGNFEIGSALTLAQIERMVKEQTLNSVIVPVDDMLREYPAVYIKEKDCRLIYNGNPFKAENIEKAENADACGQVRVYDFSGRFVGVYAYDVDGRQYKPVKMFL